MGIFSDTPKKSAAADAAEKVVAPHCEACRQVSAAPLEVATIRDSHGPLTVHRCVDPRACRERAQTLGVWAVA